MSRRLKVAIVTQYYAPDLPAWTPTGLARELSARGHSVKVLTTFPHYRTGRVSNGYRQALRFEELDGDISVKRVPMIASHSRSALGRILNYITFAVSSRFLGRSFIRGVDVIYVYATPMTVAEGPRAWARSLKTPYVLHIQDLWPESMTGSGFLPHRIARVAEAAMGPWLRSVYRRAAASIAIAPTMKGILHARGVARGDVSVVLNWSDDFDQRASEASETRALETPSSSINIIYAGNLGQLQDLETVVRAAAAVKDLAHVTFRIAGSGVMGGRLRELAAQLQATNIVFSDHLSSESMVELYQLADFQLVTLRKLDGFRGIIPSKLTSGLANGVPVISTVLGDTSELVRSAGIGFVAEPESVDSLEAAIRMAAASSAHERMSFRLRAQAHYRENMSKSHAIDQIEAILRSVVERTKQ